MALRLINADTDSFTMIPFPKATVWIGSAFLLFVAVAATCSNAMAMTTTTTTTTTTSRLSLQTEAKDARVWNRFADGYASSPMKDPASYETKLQMTRQYMNPSTTRALEFGCGTGGTALAHAPYVQRYDAIDVSSRMIKIAQAKQKECNNNNNNNSAANVYFRTQGIVALDAPDASYDIILGLSVLHLVPNRLQTIRKVHRLLKPGGIFVSSTICLGDQNALAAFVLSWVGPPLASMGILPHVSVFTKNTLRQELTDHGFVLEHEFHPGPDKAVFWIAKKVEF